MHSKSSAIYMLIASLLSRLFAFKCVGRKISGGEGGQRKKDRKIAKKIPKYSAIKPLSTIPVPCLKNTGGDTAPSAPRCRRPWLLYLI